MRGLCSSKCLNIWSYSFQNFIILPMLEKWGSVVDNQKRFGALLTDLSKAFECLSQDLLIAKLKAYGFCIDSLISVEDYLTNRKQRTRKNLAYS